MKILQYCEEHRDNCIVLLKTPNAGQEVDNGMGVEFDLREYALICKKEEEIPAELKWYETKTQVFSIRGINNLDEFIQELKERDEYEVIWRNENITLPGKIKTFVEKLEENVSVEKITTTEYSLLVSYDEIKKYCESIDGIMYDTDFFHKCLRHSDTLEGVVSKYFPGDDAKYLHAKYTKEGVKFIFIVTKRKEIKGAPEE